MVRIVGFGCAFAIEAKKGATSAPFFALMCQGYSKAAYEEWRPSVRVVGFRCAFAMRAKRGFCPASAPFFALKRGYAGQEGLLGCAASAPFFAPMCPVYCKPASEEMSPSPSKIDLEISLHDTSLRGRMPYIVLLPGCSTRPAVPHGHQACLECFFPTLSRQFQVSFDTP